MADSSINNLPSAGTIALDTNFIVQKAGSTSAGKKPLSELVITNNLEMIAKQTSELEFVTPNAFFGTNASEDTNGTVQIATDAEVEAGTSNTVVLTPAKIDNIETKIFSQDVALEVSDIDETSNVTVTATTIKLYENAKVVNIYGSITFTQNSTVPTHSIYINNIGLPAYKQGIGVTPPTNVAPGIGAGTIETSGGKTLITLTSPYGTNWATGSRVYQIFGSYIKS